MPIDNNDQDVPRGVKARQPRRQVLTASTGDSSFADQGDVCHAPSATRVRPLAAFSDRPQDPGAPVLSPRPCARAPCWSPHRHLVVEPPTRTFVWQKAADYRFRFRSSWRLLPPLIRWNLHQLLNAGGTRRLYGFPEQFCGVAAMDATCQRNRFAHFLGLRDR